MKELQRKQKIRQIMYSTPALVTLLVLTFFIARGALKIMSKERESATQTKALEVKATVLASRENKLKDGIERLKTEEGVKEEIKERYSVTQEGEHVAVIVDSRENSNSTSTMSLPWYKRFWAAIIGGE
jgi:cell division protein FtsB